MTTLPLWYGRERGTDLADLMDFDEGDDDEGGGGINEVTAGIVGLLAPAALIAVVVASGWLPVVAAVLLGIAGVAWLGLGLTAAWLVTLSQEEHPPRADAMIAVLVGLGRVIVVVALVVSLLMLVLLAIGFITALMSSDNR